MTEKTFQHRAPRSWLKTILTIPADQVDPFVGFLTDLSGGGIEQISAADGQMETIIGYLPVDSDLAAKQEALDEFCRRTLGSRDSGHCLRTEIIQEEDWGRTWKEHFKPLKISPHLIIKPTWEDYLPAPQETVIELDPGMAFGTGHHASTRLALGLIDSLFFPPLARYGQVLDVGTGTGILAMACALFGAEHVVGIDNDPDAVAVARENILLNRLAEKVTICAAPLDSLPSPFDLIIANITHDTLIEMAPLLTGRLKKNGALILAGILRGDQEKNIRRVYENLDLATMAVRTEDEWAAFHFHKR